MQPQADGNALETLCHTEVELDIPAQEQAQEEAVPDDTAENSPKSSNAGSLPGEAEGDCNLEKPPLDTLCHSEVELDIPAQEQDQEEAVLDIAEKSPKSSSAGSSVNRVVLMALIS